jgi:hypothetical protein
LSIYLLVEGPDADEEYQAEFSKAAPIGSLIGVWAEFREKMPRFDKDRSNHCQENENA